jgi:acetylornithine deacetylase/succinyl-diaminopimelate desuccinylase-like protein
VSLTRIATAGEAQRCVEDACALCEIPAPTGEEADRAAWLAQRLRRAGLEPQHDAAGNVTVRFGRAEPAVIVAAHLDTVFSGLSSIEVQREGSVLRAPGIGDNSLGVAGLLHLARRARRLDWSRRTPLLVAATVGEEGLGNLRGVRELLDTTECRELIALEGGLLDEIVVGGIGSRRLELTVTAPGGHSWKNRGGASAVHTLIGLLGALLERRPAEAVNVGTIAGGQGINVLAMEARARVDLRDADDGRLTEAAEWLRERAREASEAGEAQVHVEELGSRPGGRTPEGHALVKDALRSYRDVGLGPELTDASTDANAALGRQIPAITVGLARGHGAHSREESVDTAGLDQALTALTRLIAGRTAEGDAAP